MSADLAVWSVVTPTSVARLVERARALERRGVAGLFASQAYGPPWVPLAAAAGATERMLLASGIALAFVRSPVETALAAADMDRLTEGRFVLGLGAGVRSWHESIFGADYERPVARFRETIAVVRHVLSGLAAGDLQPFEGAFHRLSFAGYEPGPPPVRPDLPIWVAALRPAMIRVAGELGDGLLGHPAWSATWIREQVWKELRAAASGAGRDPDEVTVNLWTRVAIADDPVEAVGDAKPSVALYARLPQYAEYYEAHGFGEVARNLHELDRSGVSLPEQAAHVPDEMATEFVQVGEPTAVVEQVQRFAEGAASVCLLPPVGIPPERVRAYQRRINEAFLEPA